MKNRIDKFLEGIVGGIGGVSPKEFWPLNPSQILYYYDADFLLDFLKKFDEYKKQKKSLEDIAEKMESSKFVSNFLVNYACVGFKRLNKSKMRKTEIAEREDFFNFMLEMVDYKNSQFITKTEAFVSKNKKFLLDVSPENKAYINKFKTALFGLNWAYFYDVFADYGSDSKKPIEVFVGGKKYFLIVNEYYNQKPEEIWKIAKKSPLSRVEVYNFYEKFGYKNNSFGRLKANESLGEKLRKVIVVIDGKPIGDLEKLSKFTDLIFDLTSKQAHYVNKISDVQKVDKAIMMTYWVSRKFFGKDWKKLYLKTRKNLKIYGNKFIVKSSKVAAGMSREEKIKRFDPRNNIII